MGDAFLIFFHKKLALNLIGAIELATGFCFCIACHGHAVFCSFTDGLFIATFLQWFTIIRSRALFIVLSVS